MINRVDFYLGNNILYYSISREDKFISVNDVKNINNTINEDVYRKPLIKLLNKTNNENYLFKFEEGDIQKHTDAITLVKNRCEGNENGVILRCLEFHRHWNNFYNKLSDIPFDEKMNSVFWRGTTTGKENYKGNRFDLVKKWFKKNDNIDVGFSFICQNKEAYNNYVLGICNEDEFLKYKYILSIRGNDKDSGLQWKLNSNSLVLMPKPRIVSWLMESLMVPNVHYIELKDDFSDLEEKLIWCNENQHKCKEIIKNANYFMYQFKNIENEEKIERDVIKRYFDIIGRKKQNIQHSKREWKTLIFS